MVLTYNGISKLLTHLNISREELTKAILDPESSPRIWSRSDTLAGHRYHELSLLHDTLCFIRYWCNGRMLSPSQEIELLRDYLQDTDHIVCQSIVPALDDLGLIELFPCSELTPYGYIVSLTDRAKTLKYHACFLPSPFAEEDDQ